MSYQVLARKYRPQTFEEVIGQEPVVRALTNALKSDRTAHAYLFSGIRGVGKTTTARLLARALNCENGPTANPCGTCASCVEVSAGGALDVIEIDAATYTKVENMREVLDKTRYSPARDAYKVYIVDEVHMLSASSFNALLKTLEEPPDHVVFILATTELRKVPATIVSRCQHYEFRPVAHSTLVEHLAKLCEREEAEVSPGALSLIARRAGGSIRDSQSLLDLVLCYGDGAVDETEAARILGIADSRALSTLVAAMKDADPAAALSKLEEILSWGTDPVQLHSGLVEHVRNLLVTQVVPKPETLLPAAEEEIQEWKELGGRFREAELLRLLQLLARGEMELRQASQPRYLLEGLLVRCCLLDSLKDLEEVLRAVEGGGGLPADPPSSQGAAPRATRASRAAAPQPTAAVEVPRRSAREPQAPRRDESPESAGATSSPTPTAETTAGSEATAATTGTSADGLMGALKRASLRQWIKGAMISFEDGMLLIELPPGSETASQRLQGKSARTAILEAARQGIGARAHDLRVTVATESCPEPPQQMAESGPPMDAPPAETTTEDASKGTSGLADQPSVQTLMEVFQGKIAEDDPTGDQNR